MLSIRLREDHLSNICVVRNPSHSVETALSLAMLGERVGGPYAAWRTQALAALRHLGDPAEISAVRSASGAVRASGPAAVVSLVSHALPTGAPPAPTELGQALESYHRIALEPRWQQMQAALDHERALHARALLRGGPSELLRTIGRGVGWDGLDLTISTGAPRRIAAPTAPIVLMPSAFCRDAFVLTDAQRVTVVHPMAESTRAMALAPGPAGARRD